MESLFPPKTPDPVIVIADDLSGAAELAGIAFSRGYTAEVQRQLDATSSAAVIAVDTDSRGLSPALAAMRATNVARAAVAASPAWIYKKVDSVLRGNVRDEIEAVIRVTGQSRSLLIPANPSRGRTIVGGSLLIEGVPLDQTQFRDDPEHPRITATARELLGFSDCIDTPDVVDPSDLGRYSTQLDTSTLPAGAADFFAALLDVRGAGGRKAAPSGVPAAIGRPALLVCGSPAACQTRQRQCEAAEVPIMLVPDPFEDLESHVRQAADRLAARGSLAMFLSDDLNRARQAQELLPRLATIAATILRVMPVASVLAEGGATAAAVASQLAWNRFRVVQAAPAGVGVLQPLGPSTAPMFLIKPGSYAWPQEIWRQFSES